MWWQKRNEEPLQLKTLARSVSHTYTHTKLINPSLRITLRLWAHTCTWLPTLSLSWTSCALPKDYEHATAGSSALRGLGLSSVMLSPLARLKTLHYASLKFGVRELLAIPQSFVHHAHPRARRHTHAQCRWMNPPNNSLHHLTACGCCLASTTTAAARGQSTTHGCNVMRTHTHTHWVTQEPDGQLVV